MGRAIFFLCFGPALLAQSSPRLSVIRLTGLDDPSAARVLLINAQGEGCNDTVELPGAPRVDLTGHLGPACWQQDSLAGVIVLAKGRAPTYLPGKSLNQTQEVTVEMRRRREVRVDVWPKNEELARAARDDLANFDWILDQNRTGITLKPRFHPADEKVSAIDCRNADQLHPAQPGAINLFYGGGEANVNCGGASAAVLVHDIPVLGDVAHEIGHKLGLNQDDSERHYPNGHTTDLPRFACENVMWQKSEVLKSTLSPGQSAWMGASCSSFLGKQGECLPCAEFVEGDEELGLKAQVPRSACPRFALGQPDAEASCRSTCSDEDAASIINRLGGRFVPRDVGRVRLCTQDDLRTALRKRYRELRQHVRNRPDLQLSSGRESKFVNWWMTRIQTILIIESIGDVHRQAKANPENRAHLEAIERQGYEYLQALDENGPLKHSHYLTWARQQISRGTYSPRCEPGRGIY